MARLFTEKDTIIIPINNKYGVTEEKKSKLDHLNNEVIDAQNEVDQYQAIVDALNTKLQTFSAQLLEVETNKTAALANRDLLDTVVANAKELTENSQIAALEVEKASEKIGVVATSVKEVIDKLIFTAEIINKLANLTIRKKALNPLISDELISMLTTAGNDANNAVALTLTALNSVYASQATTLESESAMSLEFLQSVKLYEFFIGKEIDGITNKVPFVALEELLNGAYEISELNYNAILTAVKDTNTQLNESQASLNKAKVNLNSLKSAYAAANAAALAS